jgi:hypothetical protein
MLLLSAAISEDYGIMPLKQHKQSSSQGFPKKRQRGMAPAVHAMLKVHMDNKLARLGAKQCTRNHDRKTTSRESSYR